MPEAGRLLTITREVCQGWLAPRPADSHKGDFGNVGVIGGEAGMVGAALLAGRAALWLGAGRVYVGLLDPRIAVDAAQPELMLPPPKTVLSLSAPACLVVGPGLGRSTHAVRLLYEAVQTPLPLLIDADGLNLLATTPALQEALRERSEPSLLTPHPGEAGRILNMGARAIQADRVGSLRALVARYGCTVVLKGAGSLVAAPDGPIWRNTTGNPGMAAPGMGDVLCGMIAALAAQGLALEQAAVMAVHLHGAAADAAVAAGMGPVGLTAGELAQWARRLLNQWIYGQPRSADTGAV